MYKVSTYPPAVDQAGSRAPVFDKYIVIACLACAYVEIILPLLIHADTGPLVGGMWTAAQHEIINAPRIEQRIFWPVMAAISVILAIRNLYRLTLPPHIICLFAYLAFAGASILWSVKPDVSFIRFTQQAMIVTCMVLPALLAARNADMIRGLFLCFAFALIVNVFYVINQNPMIIDVGRPCYAGYFTFKGELGECAAIAVLLALYEILHPGRRLFGLIVIGIAIYLVIMSDSKGSLSIGLLAPLLGGLTFFLAKRLRVSPAVVLLPIPVFYAVLSVIVGNLVNRISWYVFGNYDLSGRTYIWDFASSEIARRPLLGWGYQAFWLSGPDAPSILDAPGWIKNMPSSHNGFLDTRVDMGYVGLVFLIVFIFATLHAIGRMLDREPARAWALLTIALYVIITNFLETGWMHNYDILWLLFVFVAADIGRYWTALSFGASEPMLPGRGAARQHSGLTRAAGLR